MTLIDQEPLLLAADELAPLPRSVVRLSSVLADPAYNMMDVVRAVELDPPLAGRLLRLANSALYSGPPVSSVSLAVTRLGTVTVRLMAIATIARPKHGIDLSVFGLTAESYWRHCVAVLSFAQEMGTQKRGTFGDDFATAALLHDFGKLLLADRVTATHVEQINALDPSLPSVEKETLVLGVNHAEVGAVVAKSWKLSDGLIRAVKYHHDPAEYDSPMCHGLNLANQFAWRLESRDEDLDRASASRMTSINALGLDEEQVESIFEIGTDRLNEILEVFQ